MLASHHAVPLSRSRSFATTTAPVIASYDVISAVPSVPSAASSSPRRHHLVITPAGHVLPAYRPAPSCRGTGRGYGLTVGYSDVVALPPCLLAPCRFRASCDFVLVHLAQSSRAVLLSRMCRRTGACDAVRSLRLLPRLSVSIVFKTLPCQSFKTLRLFGMASLCGYRWRPFYRLAVPSPFLLGCLWLIACVPCFSLLATPHPIR